MERDERAVSVDEARTFWNARARSVRASAGDAVQGAGTISDQADVVALRDRLELNHLARLWSLGPTMRVLDLAAGGGRMALRIAPHVAEITLVDLAEEQLGIARDAAAARGLPNLKFQIGSVLDVVLEGTFDLILMSGVQLYLSDSEIARMAQRCAAWLAPAGRLILKEPVSTTGVAITQVNAAANYRAFFRPRGHYAAVYGALLRPLYQRASCAHPFPFFVRGTDGAVAATRGAVGEGLVRKLGPLYVRLDPLMLAFETRLRAHAQLRHLLAPVDVLNDIYMFERP